MWRARSSGKACVQDEGDRPPPAQLANLACRVHHVHALTPHDKHSASALAPCTLLCCERRATPPRRTWRMRSVMQDVQRGRGALVEPARHHGDGHARRGDVRSVHARAELQRALPGGRDAPAARIAQWPRADLCSLPSQIPRFGPQSRHARQPAVSAGIPGVLAGPTQLQVHTRAGCSTAPRSRCRCSCRHGTGASSSGRAWFTTRPSGSGWSVKRTARPASTGHQLRWPPTAAASAARPGRAAAAPSPATTGAQPLRCRPPVKQPGRTQPCAPFADTRPTQPTLLAEALYRVSADDCQAVRSAMQHGP